MLFKFFCKKDNKGYSLVEVIVAMLILAIITIPLLTSFNVVSKANLNTREKQYASNVATNVLEAVKQYGIEETAIQMHGEVATQSDFNYFTAGSYGSYGGRDAHRQKGYGGKAGKAAAKCTDYDDFFHRTRYRAPEGLIDSAGQITRYDNDLVVRYLDNIVVEDDGYLVNLKAGLRIKVM